MNRDARRWLCCGALVLTAHAALGLSVVRLPANVVDAAPPLPALIMDMEPRPADPAPPQVVNKTEPAPETPTPEPKQAEAVLPPKPKPAPPAKPKPPAKPVAQPSSKPAPDQARAVRPQPKAEQNLFAAPSPATMASYMAKLRAWLARNMRYPASARSSGLEGAALVRFTIDENGRVLSASLARSSGHAVLDTAAVNMIKKGSPAPTPPMGSPPQTTITLTVDFVIR